MSRPFKRRLSVRLRQDFEIDAPFMGGGKTVADKLALNVEVSAM